VASAHSARSVPTPYGDRVTGHHRTVVAGLALLAVLAVLVLVVFAGNACPSQTASNPCPQAGMNRILVVGLAAFAVTLTITPFAFLAEFVVRRRIAYRGAWFRAARRGVLCGAVVAALAALRIGGALTVAVAIFVVLLAVLGEWFAARRLDGP
jgi:hypothetical protein